MQRPGELTSNDITFALITLIKRIRIQPNNRSRGSVSICPCGPVRHFPRNPKAPWKDLFINLGPADWQKYDVDWSEYEPTNRTFLNLGLPPVIQHRYREKYDNFWNARLPEELRNVKNLNQSPPYAEYRPLSNLPDREPSPSSAPPSSISPQQVVPIDVVSPGRGSSAANDGFIDGHINYYPHSPRRTWPTEDPYRVIQGMGRLPGVMAHPETDNGGDGNFGHGHNIHSTTERIIIVGSDDVVQKADVTLYVLVFMVVLLTVLLVALAIIFRRAYKTKDETTSRNGGCDTNGSLTADKSVSDLDESYIITTAMRNKSNSNKKKSNNKYESMNFCRILLQKYQRRRVKNQVFGQSSKKVSDWMTTEELAKYSPRFESKSSLNTRHSSFLSVPPMLPEKVSVAIDATPQTLSDSVLRQEPIEITKAKANYLHNNNNERIIICQEIDDTAADLDMQNRQSYSSYSSSATSEASTGQEQQKPQPQQQQQQIQQHHMPINGALPVNGHEYEQMMEMNLGDDEQVTSFIINEDINVTCRDASVERSPLTPTETVSNLQRRNFPKVLPDYPEKNSSSNNNHISHENKRHSLPSPASSPQALAGCAVPIDVHHRPPHPPPPGVGAHLPSAVAMNTATLGRRGSNHRRYRPPSRILASETMVAPEPPQEEEPETTSSTLIVGPLVKRSTESIYTTLKRGHGNEPRKMMPLPSESNSSNDSLETVKQVQL